MIKVFGGKSGKKAAGQRGSSLLEIVVALALLGIVAVTFLHALATTSSSRAFSGEQTAARVLAASQMDDILNAPYSSYYSPLPLAAEYANYHTNIQVQSLNDGNLQKITVKVYLNAKELTKLESYKVIR